MDDKIIELKLTVKHVNLILAHLSAGVYKEVIDVINLITGQGNPQIVALKNPPAVEEPKIQEQPETELVVESAPEVVN